MAAIDDIYSQLVGKVRTFGVNNGRGSLPGFESINRGRMDFRKMHYGEEEGGIIIEA